MLARLMITAATLAFVLPAAASAQSAPATVAIDTGRIAGSESDGVLSWKGIPFAAPPVGELRWRAPQPVAHWNGTRDAKAYSSDCMQVPFGGDAAPLGTKPAEDCLYLNVWKPAGVKAKLPVIVWIYGGGFVNGGASPPTYSGAGLAKQGVVFMSFNYRVGRFGTFAHPALTLVVISYTYLLSAFVEMIVHRVRRRDHDTAAVPQIPPVRAPNLPDVER